MKKQRLQFALDLVGESVQQLGYEQIGADARFIFDRPLHITTNTLIEFDQIAGTFYLIDADGQLEHLSGKWDR